jgi:hypothetical protein
VGKVKKAITILKRGAPARDHHRQTLTNSERELLAEWLLNEANHHKPKTRSDVSAKVREMLKARHTYNRSKKWGKGTVALTDLEATFANGTGDLSNTFFQAIFPWWRARGINIDLGVSRAQEEKRSKKMREPVVHNHFYGEFGLEAELVDAGIMDKDSKVCCAPPPVSRRALTPPPPSPPQIIADPRRLLNCDETPQPLDLPQKGRRAQVVKEKGKPAREAATKNQENVTVQMTWSLCGHNYGVQIVTKRKTLDDNMVITAPGGAACFNDTVDVANRQTRSCLISRTARGMQTGETFLQYLQALDEQITQRSDAEVAAGGVAILRPVVLMLDNHASRYDESVLEAATGAAPALGIRLWSEEPDTSGFLQALDQYNAKFHRYYNSARDLYKAAYLARYKKALSHVGLHEFLAILGGDAALGLPGMWFSWASPFDIIRAFKKVGISGNTFYPDFINRSEFIDQPNAMAAARLGPASPEARALLDAAAKTPPGLRGGSLLAEQAKVRELLAAGLNLAGRLEREYDPVKGDQLFMVPAFPAANPSDDAAVSVAAAGRARSRLSSSSGSFTLQGLLVDKRGRDAEAEAKVDRVKRKKEEREDRARERLAEAEELEFEFALCEESCGCEIVPCPMAKWKRCPACGPKRGVCKVKACLEARQAAAEAPDEAE